MHTITIMKGKAFRKGLSYAHRVGGQYQAATQTWALPNTPTVQRMLNAPAAYGWLVVTPIRPTAPCPRCHSYCDGDCQAVAS